MAAEGNVHERMELDESAVVEIQMEVIGFINEHGEIEMKFRCETDTANYATGIGLLEQAKAALIREWEAS